MIGGQWPVTSGQWAVGGEQCAVQQALACRRNCGLSLPRSECNPFASQLSHWDRGRPARNERAARTLFAAGLVVHCPLLFGGMTLAQFQAIAAPASRHVNKSKTLKINSPRRWPRATPPIKPFSPRWSSSSTAFVPTLTMARTARCTKPWATPARVIARAA